jgi:hypothetical protein
MTSFFKMVVILFSATLFCCYSEQSLANDIFIGQFSSETRENFGRDKYGEYVIDVVRKGDKYVLSISQNGAFKFKVEAAPCDPNKEGYLQERPPGDVYALCDPSYESPALVYSQNGIKDPMARVYSEKGVKNPRADLYYRTQYFAHIQWGFYGFRKVQ